MASASTDSPRHSSRNLLTCATDAHSAEIGSRAWRSGRMAEARSPAGEAPWPPSEARSRGGG
eukprot:463240-Rhodomonas_salina.1